MMYGTTIEEILKQLEETLDIYEAYVQDIKSEDDDLINLFLIRDKIAAFLFSPLFPIARENGMLEKFKYLVNGLRKVDLLLAENADYLVNILDFKEWRNTLPFKPLPFAWWYLLDKVREGKITVPERFPSSFSLYGLFVEGIVEKDKCQILLITPEIPVEVYNKYRLDFIRKFFKKFTENAVIDLPQLYIDNDREESLLLPTSAFWGEFKKLNFQDFHKNTYLAIPKKDSKFFEFEEFADKIKSGDRKIFSKKVLTTEEFSFVPIMLIKRKTIKVTVGLGVETDFEDISKKYGYVPQEVTIA